jgi:hypothetical protein
LDEERLFWLDLKSLHGLDTHQLTTVARQADEFEARYEAREREAVAQVFGVIAMAARSGGWLSVTYEQLLAAARTLAQPLATARGHRFTVQARSSLLYF